MQAQKMPVFTALLVICTGSGVHAAVDRHQVFLQSVQEHADVSKHSHSLRKPIDFASRRSTGATDEVKTLIHFNEADNMTQVVLDKHPGGGYTKNSSMWAKEQAWIKSHPKGMVVPKSKRTLSVGMDCILGLTILYFFVLLLLFMAQGINKITTLAAASLENCMLAVQKMIFFIPMLCVLFLAVRLRAVQLTNGHTEEYNVPQVWVNWAMVLASDAIFIQSIIALVYYGAYGQDVLLAREANLPAVKQILKGTRQVAVCVLYGGFLLVCLGIILMRGPEETQYVSAAVFCSMFLSVMYFAVHFVLGLMAAADEIGGAGKRYGWLAGKLHLMKDAASTVDMAPILCILFMAVRLRALQLGRPYGDPQSWAKAFFFVSTLSMFGQVCVTALANFVLQGGGGSPLTIAPKEGDYTHLEMLSAKNKTVQVVSSILSFLMYMGVWMSLLALLMMSRTDGGPNPYLPPSLHCVFGLVIFYIFVYGTSHMITHGAVYGVIDIARPMTKKIVEFLEKRAKEVAEICPMLCILWVSALLRALQLTHNQGAPQMWAQLFMYIGSWSVVLMTLARTEMLISGYELQQKYSTVINMWLRVLETVFLCLIFVSVVVVITAVATMTTENADGVGSMKGVVALFSWHRIM